MENIINFMYLKNNNNELKAKEQITLDLQLKLYNINKVECNLYNMEDSVQDVCLAICTNTPLFLENNNITKEELLENLKEGTIQNFRLINKKNIKVWEYKNIIAKNYWNFISARAIFTAKKNNKQVYEKEKNPYNYSQIFLEDKKPLDMKLEDYLNSIYYKAGNFNKLECINLEKELDTEFCTWLSNLTDKELSKKQKDAIFNNTYPGSAQAKYDAKKKAIKKLNKLIQEKYNTKNLKKIELQEKIDTLNKCIATKNFIITLKANINAPVINNIIYSTSTTLEEKKLIVKAINTATFKLPFNLITKLKKLFELEKNRLNSFM